MSNKKVGKLPGEAEQKGDFHSPVAAELTADKVPSASQLIDLNSKFTGLLRNLGDTAKPIKSL